MIRSVTTAILAFSLLTAGLAHAQADSTKASAASSKSWNYIVEPYLMAPSMTGTSGIHGLSTDVSVNSGDIVAALDFGAMLYFEARSAEWAYSIDGLYMDLGADGNTRLGSVKVDLKQGGVLASAFRRIEPWAELSLGLQFNSIKGGLKGSGPVAVDESGNQSWVDPYLGVRFTAPRADKWHFDFTGALGGFGVGSTFAWQAYPQIGFRFNPLFELAGGYRAMYMDYTNGSGNEKFTYKLTTYGPQLGAKFHF